MGAGLEFQWRDLAIPLEQTKESSPMMVKCKVAFGLASSSYFEV